jgi:hypothetical protein
LHDSLEQSFCIKDFDRREVAPQIDIGDCGIGLIGCESSLVRLRFLDLHLEEIAASLEEPFFFEEIDDNGGLQPSRLTFDTALRVL